MIKGKSYTLMTEKLFSEDAYIRSSKCKVLDITSNGTIIIDKSVFYPTSGGQPGDSGEIVWSGDQCCEIETAVKGPENSIGLIPKEGSYLPKPNQECIQNINWLNRFNNMRIHTALHLLSVVIPLPVTGGQISSGRGRLDFNMPEPPKDKEKLEAELNKLILSDYRVSQQWITEETLAEQPELVKTMSVSPPKGSGMIRLVRIGSEENQIDLQPCGGTHVHSTKEIGIIKLGKIENKGRQNRRVSISLSD